MEVEFEARIVFSQSGSEFRFVGDSDAVCVDHEMLDGSFANGIENVEEVWMESGFATRDLDYIGFEFIFDHGIEHVDDVLECSVVFLALWSAVRITNGALEVAVVGHLNQRQAGVLLMRRAEAAIVGATILHRRVPAFGHLARLDVDFAASTIVICIIGE